MKKNIFLSVTAAVLLALIVSCVTNWPRTYPMADTNTEKLTDIPEFDLTDNKLEGMPQEQRTLLYSAYQAMMDKKWNDAIGYLWEGAGVIDDKDSNFFLNMLSRFVSLPPETDIIDALLRLQPDNAEFNRFKDVYSLAPGTMEWDEDTVVLKWLDYVYSEEKKLWIVPTVHVKINGETFRMALDTGASVTFLSKKAAKKAGIDPLPLDPITGIGANLQKIQFSLAVAENIDLNGLHIRDTTIVILHDNIDHFPVDGAIGWPELSRMAWEMDSREKTITLYKSYKENEGVRNLFWFTVPMASLVNGDPKQNLLFFLDTGYGSTGFSQHGIDQTGAQIVGMTRYKKYFVSGSERIKERIINLSGLYLDGSELIFSEYQCNNAGVASNFHGILGIDIAQAGKVRINYPEGRLVFEPYPSQ